MIRRVRRLGRSFFIVTDFWKYWKINVNTMFCVLCTQTNPAQRPTVPAPATGRRCVRTVRKIRERRLQMGTRNRDLRIKIDGAEFTFASPLPKRMCAWTKCPNRLTESDLLRGKIYCSTKCRKVAQNLRYKSERLADKVKSLQEELHESKIDSAAARRAAKAAIIAVRDARDRCTCGSFKKKDG